jgi:hypothetical protein
MRGAYTKPSCWPRARCKRDAGFLFSRVRRTFTGRMLRVTHRTSGGFRRARDQGSELGPAPGVERRLRIERASARVEQRPAARAREVRQGLCRVRKPEGVAQLPASRRPIMVRAGRGQSRAGELRHRRCGDSAAHYAASMPRRRCASRAGMRIARPTRTDAMSPRFTAS